MKNKLILFLLFSFYAPQVNAAASFSQVLKKATQDFPSVQVSEKDQGISRADNLIALGGFDWNLRSQYTTRPQGYYDYDYWDATATKPLGFFGSRFNAGYRRGFGFMPIYDEKFRTTLGGEVFGGIEFSLLRNRDIDSIRAGLMRSEAGIRLQNAAFSSNQLEVIRQVSIRYWDWFFSYVRNHVQKSLLVFAEERDSAIQKRVTQGDLPRFEKEDNERVIIQRKSDLVIAERSLQKAQLELSLYDQSVDEPIETVQTPEAPFSEAHFLESQARIESHPDIDRFARLEEQNQIDYQLAKNQLQPRLDLQLQGSKDTGDSPKTLTPFGLEVRLGLEIPLQTNALRGRSEVAQIQGDKLMIQKKFAIDRLKVSLKDSHQNVLALHERVLLLAKEKQLALRLAQGERTRFKLGDSNLIFVNLRENAAAEAAIREAQAYADYKKARMEYLISAGDLAALVNGT